MPDALFDSDAERAVLSACLLHPETLDEIGQLAEDDFADVRHRRLFRAVKALDAAAERIDLVTVAHQLKAAGDYDRAGGAAYLAEIVDATPALANVGAHARIVSSMARVRGVVDVCRSLVAESTSATSDPTAWLAEAEARMFEATKIADHADNLSTIGEMVTEQQAEMRRRLETKSAPPGVTTGFPSLDRQIGGLKDGNKYVLAAVPGAGKTAIALQMALAVAASGTEDEPAGVVFASIEMTRPELSARAVAQQSGVPETTIERGEPDAAQWSAITGAINRIASLPMVVDDTATQTTGSLRGTVRRGLRRLRQKFGEKVRLRLIVIDHLHIQSADAKHGNNRNNDLTQLSDGNRRLAKEFCCPVVELNQLNRDAQADKSKPPAMRHLRECGAIEQDAYGILMLHRPDVYADPGETKTGDVVIAVRKIRQGGEIGSVDLKFTGQTVSFSDPNPNPPPEPEHPYAADYDGLDTYPDRADLI